LYGSVKIYSLPPIKKVVTTLRRFLVVLAALAQANGQDDSDVRILRILQWVQSVVQSSVSLPPRSKAEVTLEVRPQPEGGDALAGVVESSLIGVALVFPDGRRIAENDSGSVAIDRTHHERPQGLGFSLELFPNRDVVSFMLPKGSPPGTYRIEADSSGYGKNSVLVGAYLPARSLDPASDDVSISLMYIGASSSAAEGCPNTQTVVTVSALCGDKNCTGFNVSATAQSKGLGSTELRYRAEPLKEKESLKHKSNQAFSSVLFPELPSGDYDINTIIRVTPASGTPITREEHSTLKVPPANAIISNVREMPPRRNDSGHFDSLDITADVEVESTGEYEFVLDLLPALGGHEVHGETRQHFEDVGLHEMRISVPAREIRHLDGNGPFLILDPRRYRSDTGAKEHVCVAHVSDSISTRPYSLAEFGLK
jgi:hypothetical protein